MLEVFYLSSAVASLAFLVSEAEILKKPRMWVKNRLPRIGKIVSCGFCAAHWLAFGLVLIYTPRLFESWWIFDYTLTILVIAWFGSFQWAVLCWIMDKIDLPSDEVKVVYTGSSFMSTHTMAFLQLRHQGKPT